jgi:vacuolar-type H+-ATPase subunit F/Vma7
MPAIVYIGDEIGAAGYRLAGVRTIVPGQGAETAALSAARAEAPLVLVAATVASRVASHELDAALAALAPLTLIVPDLDPRTAVPDTAARLRRELGLEA